MKRISLNILMQFTLILALTGQDSKKFFIGLQPDITREIKDNEEKVFSVNVMPLVVQAYLNEHTGIRLSPVMKLGASYFSHVAEVEGWRNHAGVMFSLGYTFRSK